MPLSQFEVPPENDAPTCPVCSAVLHLAGQQHLIWDRRIEAIYAGTETFETLDSDPVTRLPDGIPLKIGTKWLAVSEVRALYAAGHTESIWDLIDKLGHATMQTPMNNPEADA